MNFKKLTAATVASVLMLGVAAPLMAQDASVYEAREQQMKTFGMTLQGVMKGEITDKTAAAQTFVDGFAGLAELFPEGTGMDANPASKAKPEIWTRWEEFAGVIAAGQEASDALLVAANSGDDAAFMQAMQAVGGTCGQCHQGLGFRAK